MENEKHANEKLVYDLVQSLNDAKSLNDGQQDGVVDQELASRFESAKKIMALIDKARPHPDPNLTDTVTDQVTLPETSQARDHPKSDGGHVEVPATIGRFVIEKTLGRGGFGLVFLAMDPDLKRRVAIKVPQLNSLLNADAQARFSREGRALGSLNHPNIVPVFEVGSDGPITYITSEYVPGINLAEWVNQRTDAIADNVAAEILCDLADAIHHAHSRGVIHRDIKPANILVQVESDSQSASLDATRHIVRITDFGLAKLLDQADQDVTQSGSVIGTPAFAAPEQLLGSSEVETTVSVDVYSLGAVLYFLLTGQTPFAGQGVLQTIADVQHVLPPSPRMMNPNRASDLSAICMKCLEKSPEDRYATAHDLKTDLLNFLNDEPVQAQPITDAQRFWRWCHRNRAIAALSIIALTSVVTGLVLVTTLLIRSENLRADAEIARARSTVKASQLTEAIDRLFTAIADSKTIRLEGAAPLRERLLHEAHVMYEQLAADDQDDENLQLERARSVYRLAKLNQLLGNTERSLELADECLVDAIRFHTNGLIGSTEFIEWHGFSAEQLNDLGRFDEADNKYNEAFGFLKIDPASFVDNMANVQPNDQDELFSMFVANVLSRRAILLLHAGNFEDAELASEKAMRMWNQIPAETVGENISGRFYKAGCLLVRGTVLEKKREFPEAERSLVEAIDLIRPLADDPVIRRMSEKERLAQALLQLGISIAQQNRLEEARPRYQESVKILEEIVDLDPRVIRYQKLLCSVRYSLAVTEMLSEQYETAEDLSLQNTLQLQQILDEGDPSIEHLWRQLANNFNLLSVIRIRSPKRSMESAANAIEQAIEFLEMTADARPNWNPVKLDLSRSLHNLADIYFSNGQFEKAIAGYRLAIEQIEDLVESQPTWAQAQHSLALSQFGLAKAISESGDFATALEHSQKAVQASGGSELQMRIEEARLMACVGEIDTAYQQLASLVENEAATAEQFVYAASRAELVHVYLSQEKQFADQPIVSDNSFRNLALESMRQGLDANVGERDSYFDLASQRIELRDLVSELKQTMTERK